MDNNVIMEKRAYLRKNVDYLAELWVKKTFALENDVFNDIGFRGTIKDVSLGGLLFGDFINLNLMGLELRTVVREKSMVKVVMYTKKKRVELIGKISRMNNRTGFEAMGISLNSHAMPSSLLEVLQ